MNRSRTGLVIPCSLVLATLGLFRLSAQETSLVRDHHEMVFDSQRGRLVLHGGNSRDAKNAYTYENDTWTFSDGSWSLIAARGPEARSSFSMAYDPERRQILVFGGFFQGRAYDDTWLFDGTQWNRVSGEGPSARMSPALCYDPLSRGLLLFGGMGRRLYGDTWAWNGKEWTLKSQQGPSGRSRTAMFHDRKRKRALLYGGYTREGGQARSAGDLWEWNGEQWSEVDQGSPKPPPLSNHRAVYDDRRNVAVLFGGSSEHGVYLDQTWEWDGAGWTQRRPGIAPPARGNFSMAYDSSRQCVVLHGGKTGSARTLSDLWTWDGENWEPLPLEAASQKKEKE